VVVDEIVNGYHYNNPNDANDWINYTFHHDQLNSVITLSGTAGSIEETTGYDAFGKPLALALPGTGNDMLYTGREYDRETGLYYYRARYYDPEIGRFISEDPLEFKAGVNFYTYVGNNPVNANDPMGLVGIFGGPSGSLGTVPGANVSASALGILGTENNQIAVASSISGKGTIFAAGLAGPGRGFTGGFFINDISDFLNSTSINIDTPIGGMSLIINESGNFEGLGFSGPSTGLAVSVNGPSFDLFNEGLSTGSIIIPDIFDSFQSSVSNASGGFVIYPNKPNTNMIQGVYNK